MLDHKTRPPLLAVMAYGVECGPSSWALLDWEANLALPLPAVLLLNPVNTMPVEANSAYVGSLDCSQSHGYNFLSLAKQ